VKRGEIDLADAKSQLDYIRKLNVRLLGDRVLQQLAWKISDELKWPDTYTAEYVALTKLQADAFITLDLKLKRAVEGIVKLANLDDLLGPHSTKAVAKGQRQTKRGSEK
jgi:predicted nucleic acid-binding protein